MKKIIGLFAAAALAFGVIGCTNDDLNDGEYLTRDSADEGATGNYSTMQTAKNFTVKDSSGTVVTSISVKQYLDATLTLSAENIEADVADEKVATASVSGTSLKITGVSEGTTVVSLAMPIVSSEQLEAIQEEVEAELTEMVKNGYMTSAEAEEYVEETIASYYTSVGSVTVTVEAATIYQAAWFDTTADLSATLSGSTGYDTAITASDITPNPNSSFDATTTKFGSLKSVTGYYLQQAEAVTTAANSEFINYTFSATANKDLTLDKLSFNAENDQSGNSAIQIYYSTDGETYTKIGDATKASSSKTFAISQSLSSIGKIESGKTIYFKISHYATKAFASKKVAVVLGQVHLTFLDNSAE